MLKGFRQFIMRGNVIDLAVAVVIGAAFGTVVSSFVGNIITPLLAAILAKPDFSGFKLTIHGSVVAYGVFLNALISFLNPGRAQRHARRSHYQEMSRMPERNTDCRPPLRLLHFRSSHAYGGRKSLVSIP